MRPESLTVHSLAIKRASRLNILRQQYTELSIKNTDSIIAMTEQTARDLNMQPYYMYRQKNMAGNFENVGYAVAGLECIYNILIMEVSIMEYLTATELSKVWNISTRRIGVLCTEGRVDGAIKKGKMWLIPDTAQKPADARYKKNKHNA